MFGHVSQSIGRALPGGGGGAAVIGDVRYFAEAPGLSWALCDGSLVDHSADLGPLLPVFPKAITPTPISSPLSGHAWRIGAAGNGVVLASSFNNTSGGGSRLARATTDDLTFSTIASPPVMWDGTASAQGSYDLFFVPSRGEFHAYGTSISGVHLISTDGLAWVPGVSPLAGTGATAGTGNIDFAHCDDGMTVFAFGPGNGTPFARISYDAGDTWASITLSTISGGGPRGRCAMGRDAQGELWIAGLFFSGGTISNTQVQRYNLDNPSGWILQLNLQNIGEIEIAYGDLYVAVSITSSYDLYRYALALPALSGSLGVSLVGEVSSNLAVPQELARLDELILISAYRQAAPTNYNNPVFILGSTRTDGIPTDTADTMKAYPLAAWGDKLLVGHFNEASANSQFSLYQTGLALPKLPNAAKKFPYLKVA